MYYKKSVIELIKARQSCRDYSDRQIEMEKKELLEAFLKNTTKENFRFILVDKENNNQNSEKLGTYGVIKGATTFLVGIMDKNLKNIESFGYAFEEIILYATELGLGTCWLGGSFNKKDFSNKIELCENEMVPIVSPIGYKANTRKIINKVFRTVIHADKRKLWEEIFFEENDNIPLRKTDVYEYEKPLEMLRLAPSASNKQPWRIIKSNNFYHFFIKRAKRYGNMFTFDIQRNDIGIAMCHFELTVKELGLKGSWSKETISLDISDNELEYIVSWKY